MGTTQQSDTMQGIHFFLLTSEDGFDAPALPPVLSFPPAARRARKASGSSSVSAGNKNPDLILPQNIQLLQRDPHFHCRTCRDLKTDSFPVAGCSGYSRENMEPRQLNNLF